MKVDKADFDTLMADNDENTLGFCITLKSGDGNSNGKEVSQCFIASEGSVTEIARMNGYMINLLSAHSFVTEEEAGAFRLLWRKIIKS